jgi:uncharacterized protein (DUF2267 family)
MSQEHVAALEHTVQQTNVWLKRLAEEHHFSGKSQAYSALRAVLHSLRDRLPPEAAVHLGAQLPILVRGIYYEGWRLGGKPSSERTMQEFLDRVASELPPQFPRDALGVTEAVYDLLWKELDPGEVAKVIELLPASLRSAWPRIARH